MIFPRIRYYFLPVIGAGSLIINTAPITLLLTFGHSLNAVATRYLQFFNQTIAPIPNQTPFVDLKVSAGASFSLEPFYSDNNGGLYFDTGLVIGISTTPTIFTPSGVAEFEVSIQFGEY
jgi:hypothetical protein